jgi:hypothetical protein
VIKYRFLATKGGENLPLEEALEFQPGRKAQQARRVAVGHLLALTGAEHAIVDASADDLVRVETPDGVWIIAEGTGIKDALRP